MRSMNKYRPTTQCFIQFDGGTIRVSNPSDLIQQDLTGKSEDFTPLKMIQIGLMVKEKGFEVISSEWLSENNDGDITLRMILARDYSFISNS
jgi:hypothetical protein